MDIIMCKQDNMQFLPALKGEVSLRGFNNEIEKALVTGEMELPKEEDVKRLNYIFDEKKRKPKDIVSSINE